MINVLADIGQSMLIGGLIGAGVGLIVGIIVSILKRKSKTKQKEPKKALSVSEDVFLSHVGGKENIVSYKLVGSRLSLELKDKINGSYYDDEEVDNLYQELEDEYGNPGFMDKEALKADNIEGIIEMSNKIVLVKEDLSEELKILEGTKID